MKKVIYVVSDTRSGSTLLDQLLGAHDQIISLGEVHQLPAYSSQDRSLYDPAHPLVCSCGEIVDTCVFWTKVHERLGRSLSSLVLKPRFFERSGSNVNISARLNAIPKRLFSQHPILILNQMAARLLNAKRVAVDSFALFDAIFEETGALYLVDSSKLPFRFRILYDHRPDNMVVIALGRDYRATVHSKAKRGRDIRAGAQAWADRMNQIKVLTSGLTGEQLIRLRYEDLCLDPHKELARICDFLKIGFSNALLTRPSTDVHHLGGSPSKFDPARRAIKLDLSYVDAFTEKELTIMRDIVGDLATEWGYM